MRKVHSHYVQKEYLRAFADSDGLVWVYDKPCHTIRGLPPIRVAGIKGFYQYIDVSGALQDFEHDPWLQALERDGIKLLRVLRSGVLDVSEKERFAQYVVFAALRTPSFQRCFLRWLVTRLDLLCAAEGIPRLNVDIGALTLAHERDSGIWSVGEAGVLRLGKGEAAMAGAFHLHKLLTEIPRLASMLAVRTWRVLRTSDSAFLTSDNPCTTIFPPGSAPVEAYLSSPLVDGEQRVLFPLTTNACLLIRPGSNQIDYVNVEAANAHELNTLLLNHADTYVFSPKPAIAELLPRSANWLCGQPPLLL